MIAKRICKALVIVLLFSFATPISSHALFGLSKCERVKKNLKAIEEKFISDIGAIRGFDYKQNVRGYEENLFALTPESIKIIQRNHKSDPIKEIWKLAYNNDTCFTNTQKLRIKELANEDTKDYMNFVKADRYTYSPECKGVLGIFGDEKKRQNCFISSVSALTSYKKYKSLNKY